MFLISETPTNKRGPRYQDYNNVVVEGIKFIVVITVLQRALGDDIHLCKQE